LLEFDEHEEQQEINLENINSISDQIAQNWRHKIMHKHNLYKILGLDHHNNPIEAMIIWFYAKNEKAETKIKSHVNNFLSHENLRLMTNKYAHICKN
jgi:hypothetical protein